MRPALTGQTILIPRSEDTDRIANTLALRAKESNSQYELLQSRQQVEAEQLHEHFNTLDDQLRDGHAARSELLDRVSNPGGLAAAVGLAMASANGVSRDQFERELNLLHMVAADAQASLNNRHKMEVNSLQARQKLEYEAQINDMLAAAGMTTDFDPCQLILRTDPTAEHWIMDIVRVDQDGEPILEPEDIFEEMMSSDVHVGCPTDAPDLGANHVIVGFAHPDDIFSDDVDPASR